MTFADMVAQLAHFAWGALLVDALSRRIKITYALALTATFFVTKEVLESVWGLWEPRQPWSSGIEDIAFWTIGLLAGYIVYRFNL